MPVRVKAKKAVPDPPGSPGFQTGLNSDEFTLPDIDFSDSFRQVTKKLSLYIANAVDVPCSFDQLRTTSAGDHLRTLVDHLSNTVSNPAIVNALLALRWHYVTNQDERRINEARANACEIVAWRFLTCLSEREVVEYCLYEIPDASEDKGTISGADDAELGTAQNVNESTTLLGSPGCQSPGTRSGHAVVGSMRHDQVMHAISRLTLSQSNMEELGEDEDPTKLFTNLNALEIAAVAEAKRFLSQHVVQKIITDIWNGRIVFWDSLSVHSTKRPHFYNPSTADPFSRLRVPKYLKAYEIAFFVGFLIIYYDVLIEHNHATISPLEILLYLWFASFAYDELSEYKDAGFIFYAVDMWNVFDMIMIAIGIVFALLRFIGLGTGNPFLIDLAFDILSLEALFMVPRVSSILSLSPYWGTLIPCLREMVKDFAKFMLLVVILYLGFLTTFSLVGRSTFSFRHMTMIVTRIFFGGNSVGFDVMEDIDPIFGPPLMIIFVVLTNILLMGSLTGMLSNTFSKVITHAREEYLHVYSVYVLEASTSNRLTHFYPPFNLISLCIFRPLRLLGLRSHDRFRHARILLLKATHLPVVGAIQFYEWLAAKWAGRSERFNPGFRGPPPGSLKRRQSTLMAGRPTSRSNRPPSNQRPQMRSPRPSTNAGVIRKPSLRPRKSREEAMAEGGMAGGASSGSVEARISDLSSKIDQLTALVSSLQAAPGTETVGT